MGNEKDNKMQNDETLVINSLEGFKLGHINITSLQTCWSTEITIN